MINKLLDYLADLVFPKLCLLCNNDLSKTEPFICLDCEYNLPINDAILDDKVLWGRSNYASFASVFLFQKNNPIQKIIYEIKYKKNPDLAKYMGSIMALKLKEYIEDLKIDCIVAVPMHSIKMKKRGFNQVEKIALGIREITNIDINNSIIKKIKNTTTQTNLRKFKRWENSKDIYQVSKTEGNIKNILLIDDVITTGATIEECCNAIYKVNKDVKIHLLFLAQTI